MNRKTKVLMVVVIAALLVALQALFILAPPEAPESGTEDDAVDHNWNDLNGNSTAPSPHGDGEQGQDDGSDDSSDEGEEGNETKGKDSDGDGIDDASDKFPHDEDNDGCADGEDLFLRQDAAFNFTLSGFRVLDQVDPSDATGEVYFLLTVNGQSVGRLDNGGEPWTCQVNVVKAIGETFRVNVDDDQRFVTVALIMYDEDGELEHDVLDIDGTSITGRTLVLTFDMVSGTYEGNDVDGIASGSEDSTAYTDDDDAIVFYSLQRTSMPMNQTYLWSYGGHPCALTASITAQDYASAKGAEVTRSGSGPLMALLVTPQDSAVQGIAADLSSMASTLGLDDTGKLNLALSFVQSLRYACNNQSAGSDNYWRFPVETLYDEIGDGEDTSVLFASIAEAMGYDAVLLMYPSHTAVGVATGEGDSITYQGTAYYYCDTITDHRLVGDMPAKYEGQTPNFIVQV